LCGGVVWWQFYGVAQRRNAQHNARGVTTMKWQDVKQRLSEALSDIALGRSEDAAVKVGRLIVALRRAVKRKELEHWKVYWLMHDLHGAARCFRQGWTEGALIYLQSANKYVWLILEGEA